jgi:hypothetical protein
MNDDDRPIVPTIERIRSDGFPTTDHVRLEPVETPWGECRTLGEMMLLFSLERRFRGYLKVDPGFIIPRTLQDKATKPSRRPWRLIKKCPSMSR